MAAGHEVSVIPAPEQVHGETLSGLGVAADEWSVGLNAGCMRSLQILPGAKT